MVRRRPQASGCLLVLAVSAVALTSCIPVPLGAKSPHIEHSRYVMGEGDAAHIHISPEYRQFIVSREAWAAVPD